MLEHEVVGALSAIYTKLTLSFNWHNDPAVRQPFTLDDPLFVSPEARDFVLPPRLRSGLTARDYLWYGRRLDEVSNTQKFLTAPLARLLDTRTGGAFLRGDMTQNIMDTKPCALTVRQKKTAEEVPYFPYAHYQLTHWLTAHELVPVRKGYVRLLAGPRQRVEMRLGKALKMVFPDASDEFIREATGVAYYTLDDLKLQLTTSAERMEWVYVNGPTSCMSGPPSRWGLPLHPARCYAAGDIALAYVLDPTDPNRVILRSLINLRTHKATTVYGNPVASMNVLLTEAGYALGGSLKGCRMPPLKLPGGLYAPQVDGADCGTLGAESHVIGDPGWNLTNHKCRLNTLEACAICGALVDTETAHLTPTLLWACQECEQKGDSHVRSSLDNADSSEGEWLRGRAVVP